MTRASLSLLALVAATACSHGTTKIGAQPSWRDRANAAPKASAQPLAPITFSPSTAAVVHYNERFEVAPKAPLGDAMLAAVREAAVKANVPVPVADARLFRACEDLAQIVTADSMIDNRFVEFALQRNGIIEPTPHLVVVWGSVDDADYIVAGFRPRLAEMLADGQPVRFGIGAAKRNPDGSGPVVFALQESGVSTNPIPRSLGAGASTALDAVVEPRYKDPELYITREDGSTEQVRIALGKSGGFKAQLACGSHLGRQQVEITANDERGSTVLANFPMWCGEQPPESLTVDAPTDDDVVPADEAERRMLALVNRERQVAGLPTLTWDDKVAAVARKHSEEMQRTGVVAHISPTTGSAVDRVHGAGIRTALVLENVASASTAAEAHVGLMNSPGHRTNVLSPLATHVGIGVVLGEEIGGRPQVYVTQVFTRVPPTIDPHRTAQIVGERISAVRTVRTDTGLTAIAQDLAAGLAAGKTRDALWPAAKKRIDALGNRFGSVGSVATATADLDMIVGRELLGDYKPDAIGVGIAQGSHPQIGDGAIWIVVLFAEQR